MAQVGRISGPLLKDNLLRNGKNLSFETNLLYLNVNGNRIGINNVLPLRDLDTSGTSQTIDLIASTSADLGNLSFTNGRVDNYQDGPININASTVKVPSILTQDMIIDDNFITTVESNSNLELRAGGTGLVTFTNTGIDNNLTIDGSTTFNRLFINGQLATSGEAFLGDFKFSSNVIETISATNLDFELRANASGNIVFKNIVADQDFDVVGLTDLKDLTSTGTVTINGNINQTGVTIVTGNVNTTTLDVDNSVQFENIRIDQNKIETTISDSNLEFEADGIGTVELFNDANIYGSLNATGDITLDGSITFGDANTDTIDFNADVDSDIIPATNSSYILGSDVDRFSTLNTVAIESDTINTTLLTVNGVTINTTQGNIFYISTNGDDANKGDHQQAPFRTIKHALTVSDSSIQGPVTIYLYPGEYEEEFPLIVPSNVTIKGVDIRNCTVKPTIATQNNDAFLLEGETTIEDITIKDFYSGYAFRYNSGALISSRSPYIRNVSVITKGSVTSASDPRGFDQGDAGKGALVDGADVDSNSIEASMLFHSVTFITPGVDAITMTNGVRVEWLNSFSYFANRGLYATQGATGRLTNDGSTIRFGAEIRSIGSACVYGNYGAEADGVDTLMYLIGHNFAYIGLGKNKENDNNLTIQDNETVKLNNGKIYYTSTDATGTYRVGDDFFVDFETGNTSISTDNIAFDGNSSILIETLGNTTEINSSKVETGNIRISGNTLQSVNGNVVIKGASGIVNFNDSVNMPNLNIVNDFTIGGDLLTLGDQITDSLIFEAELDQDLLPNVDSTYNLGSTTSTWNKAFLSETLVDELDISNNIITTTTSNADLELRANGTGNVYLPNNNLKINNNLSTNGLTSLQDITVVGTLTLGGVFAATGDYSVTNYSVNQNLNINSQALFEEILFDGNVITTTSTNADLELRANSFGRIYIPNQNVEIDNNMYINGDLYTADINVNTSLDFNDIIVPSNIQIDDNFIRTTVSNSNLELRANGTGSIWFDDLYIKDNNIRTENSLDIILSTKENVLDIDTTGAVKIPTGSLAERTNTISDVRFDTNFNIFEGFATSNIAFSGVYSDNRQTRVTTDNNDNILFTVQDLEIGKITTDSLTVDQLLADEIQIDGNVISTVNSNADLDLIPNGTGTLKIKDLGINDNIIYNTHSGGITVANIDNGYTKFVGNVVIPTGGDADRRVNPEIGETRWNIDRQYMEVWNGTQWGVATGGGEAVSADVMNEFLNLYTLVLG